VGLDPCCRADRPVCVLVVGEVKSTLACCVVGKKMGVPVADVGAGLGSRDMAMPEEINRIVTDSISDWLFVTEPSGVKNLLGGGKPAERIHHVGHVMVDNLMYQCDKLAVTDTSSFESAGLKSRLGTYSVVTLHRASNVDTREALERIAAMLRML